MIENDFDLGMGEYEIFSEEYRTKLNNKIIQHYYFHEIGFETAGRFKHYLNTTLNEIMPYYNKLIQSELLEINPLLSFQRNTTSDKDTTNSANTTATDSSTKTNNATQGTDITQNKNVDSTSTNNEQDVYYDTPNGSLLDITATTYATNVTKQNGSNVLDETETNTSSEDVTKTETETNGTTSTGVLASTQNETNSITENGFEISLSELLLKYRDTFIKVDIEIINELSDLFMQIY